VSGLGQVKKTPLHFLRDQHLLRISKTFNKDFLLQGLARRCEDEAACIAKAANRE
jgi:hypothetical protein